MKLSIFCTILILVFLGCKEERENEVISMTYPEVKKVDTLDTYFGVEVKDPYRWLEDDRSKETAAWVKAENEVTFGYLEKIPFREALKQRLSDLWNYEKVGPPFHEG